MPQTAANAYYGPNSPIMRCLLELEQRGMNLDQIVKFIDVYEGRQDIGGERECKKEETYVANADQLLVVH